MTDENPTEVATSNIGYASVPEGFVFVPAITGDADVLKKLFDAVDDPEDVVTRPGYGYVVPEAAAAKAGLESQQVVEVVDLSTPETSPAANALDTQDTPVADNVGDTADGLRDDTGATAADAAGADTTSTSTSSSKKSSAAAAAS